MCEVEVVASDGASVEAFRIRLHFRSDGGVVGQLYYDRTGETYSRCTFTGAVVPGWTSDRFPGRPDAVHSGYVLEDRS